VAVGSRRRRTAPGVLAGGVAEPDLPAFAAAVPAEAHAHPFAEVAAGTAVGPVVEAVVVVEGVTPLGTAVVVPGMLGMLVGVSGLRMAVGTAAGWLDGWVVPLRAACKRVRPFGTSRCGRVGMELVTAV
jgi:hypothetical protein